MLAILSDIHANLPALEAVLADVKARGDVDEIHCLGDVVGYGADPNECVRRLRSLKQLRSVVQGNHDQAAAHPELALDFNPVAQLALAWTARELNSEARSWLAGLPARHSPCEGVLCVHGSPDSPIREYITDLTTAQRIFSRHDFTICFVGHWHRMGYFTEDAWHPVTEDTETEVVGRLIVNVGSVGQPRDGVPTAGYCLFDPEGGVVLFRRVEYDVGLAQQHIMEAGLPPLLATRLSVGH